MFKLSVRDTASKVIAPAIAISLGLLLSTSAAAQTKTPAKAAAPAKGSSSSGVTPRMADEHPDLTGLWGTDDRFILNKVGNKTYAGLGGGGATQGGPGGGLADPKAKLAYDPKDPDKIQARLAGRDNAARLKAPNQPPYKPELLAKVRDLEENENQLDPFFACHPAGVPRMGAPRQIFSSPGRVVFLYANDDKEQTFRVMRTDGRPHRTDVDESYRGDSTAHWDGDTLVVDVNNFNDDTWLGIDGWFHSTKLHVVERFTRKGDTLTYNVTVEDPEVFTRPWEMNPRTLKLNTDPNDDIIEAGPCVELDRGHMVSHEHL